ncbi:MAG: hypothetical protein A2Z94_00305 [Gallionellales bacterium GWA2_55_18]|nr:MAG: hypothetical protein A2Z94_00305 [Gallionellales bacterium GWA2_55_18]
MLADHLSPAKLKKLAGPAVFARGEAYFNSDAVSRLKMADDTVSAKVAGSYSYAVKLWEEDGEIEYECSCPHGEEGNFCKHCVAVGLAWLAESKSGSGTKSGKQKKANPWKEITDFVGLQDAETLTEWLLEAAKRDDVLYENLLLKARRTAGPASTIKAFRAAIDRAVKTGGYVDWHEMPTYAAGLESIADSLSELLQQGQATALIDLAEYAVARVEAACEYVDDSNGGEMTDILERLGELHYQACMAARPDPVALAERLFKYEMADGFDAFYDSLRRYAKVLGKEGATRYKKLAEEEWHKVEPLTQETGRGDYDGRRWRITRIMECFAELSGDIEALVAVKSRDLSSPLRYLDIAEIYRSHRRGDQALEWAERGVKAFSNKPDDRLRDFLAEEYLRRKRNDEAMQLIWVQFAERPSLGSYQKLHQFAKKAGVWLAFREQALGHLDRLIASEAGKRHYHSSAAVLVEIHLWEKNTEAAWDAASRGPIFDQLWLKLAAAREEDHPGDAVPIYRRLIETAVGQTNNTSYEEAIKLLKRLRPLVVRLGTPTEFGQYVALLRAKYKAKRNFIKLLDKL